jgi:hypothetical protein
MYEYKGYMPKYGWLVDIKTLEDMDKEGLLLWKDGVCTRYKKYLDEREERVNSVWTDIITARGKERIGYPTQKPEALVERIVRCASNEGQIVLDPFMGGGTTMVVADKLKRQWIGIDSSAVAVRVTEMRLNKTQDMMSEPFAVQLHKYDYDTLRNMEAHSFADFIIGQFGGTPNIKKVGDGGIDGYTSDSVPPPLSSTGGNTIAGKVLWTAVNENTPIQVKRSDGVGRNVIDNFMSAVRRYDSRLFEKNKAAEQPVGYIIGFSFGSGLIQEVSRLKIKEGIIIKLVKVEEIVPIAHKPALNVAYNTLGREGGNWKIEFTATAQCDGDSKISNYAYDFKYKPDQGFDADQYICPDGKAIQEFGVGTHNIAVKVVDDEGLESVEAFTLVVNGGVKRE